MKYFYTNMGKFEEDSNFYGWRIPFSGKSFIVSYDGKISAGVNLSRASVKKEGGQVVVTLPQPEILSHEIDQKSLKVYDESRNIFNQISVEDYAQFSVDQQEAMEQKAVEGGLLEEAKGAAERALTWNRKRKAGRSSLTICPEKGKKEGVCAHCGKRNRALLSSAGSGKAVDFASWQRRKRTDF